MLLLMHSLTGCTVPDEAIEPEEKGAFLCRSFVRIKKWTGWNLNPRPQLSRSSFLVSCSFYLCGLLFSYFDAAAIIDQVPSDSSLEVNPAGIDIPRRFCHPP